MLGVIQVQGSGARQFLQGQLTCDMNALQIGDTCLGVYCDIKGRVQNIFHVMCQDDNHFFLFALQETLEHSTALLNKYARFSKVSIEDFSKQYDFSHYSSVFTEPNLQRLKKGIPMIHAATQGLFLPHTLNLVELNAISFNKGCYLGQEIIARTQFRGKVKKHAVYIEVEQAIPPKMGENIDPTQPESGVWVEFLETAPQHYAGLAIIPEC